MKSYVVSGQDGFLFLQIGQEKGPATPSPGLPNLSGGWLGWSPKELETRAYLQGASLPLLPC